MKQFIPRILIYSVYAIACMQLSDITPTQGTLNTVMTSPTAILILGIAVAALYQRMHTFDFFVISIYMLISLSMFPQQHANQSMTDAGATLIIIFTFIHLLDIFKKGFTLQKK